MTGKPLTVLEKLSQQCRMAHQGRKPFIMVDTESIELMHALILQSNLVPLMEKHSQKYGNRLVSYYRHSGTETPDLTGYINFHDNPEELQYAGVDRPESPAMPSVYLIHLTNIGSNSQPQADPRTLSLLKAYRDRYRTCRDLHAPLRSCRVLVYGDPALIPQTLQNDTMFLTEEFPQVWELAEMVIRLAAEESHPIEDSETARTIAAELAGFSLFQARHLIQQLLWADEQDGIPLLFLPEQRRKLILEQKAQVLIQNGGLLTLWDPEDENYPGADVAALGGMAQYQEWIKKVYDRIIRADHYAINRGTPSPKGVLLCGPPGCGKSEAAKVLQASWKLPMLCMDIGRLMQGLVGASERNMRLALRQVEIMSPAILWIDEIDKGMSPSSGSSSDSAILKRMFGTLLIWLQNKTSPTYVFATGNDITGIPPELFRRGRFDNLFSLSLPTRGECMDILKKQLAQPDRMREVSARKFGLELPGYLTFDTGCTSPETLGSIIGLLTKNANSENNLPPEQVRFVTGADLQYLLYEALNQLPDSDFASPISSGALVNAFRKVLELPTTITNVSGSANLDAVAACYVRMFRRNFVSATPEDELLFSARYYQVVNSENNTRQVLYDHTPAFEENNYYDQALYQALKPRICQIGSMLETAALQQLAR